ncbi:hypothetical protein [Rathayibacter sp. VKM Ac-2754]|uniref:hypothetical protein n=1 Tax=Rathayibacter sp. VKM Ac-2754 TaxID=2609251 RepID=UPI001358C081|nr:hypothetical protein [Rathayibacter sp. VKM Ac-2754]MWV59587.1 hypothetical protein [Rathayibacter sp. VKM Ac-2754]
MTSTVAPTARGRWNAIGREAAGLLLVLAATLLVLWRLSSTPWWTYLLSEGDSLALPLLVESVQRGEPMQWVMTSQLLVFPELPLYLVSLVLAGGGSAGSLVASAFVNVAVIYLALRWLAASVLAGRSPLRRVAAATVATVVVLLLVATEGRGMINGGAFASGILFTTYYSGVVLAGLVVLALMGRATGGFDPARPPSRRRLLLSLVGIAAVSAGTTLSNPLFALQFTAPAVASLLVVLVLRRMAWRRVAVLSAVLVVSAAVGLAARGLLIRFVAVDASTYLHLERAGTAVDGFILQMREVGAARSGKLEILVVACLLLAAAATLVVAVAAQVRPERARQVRDASVVLAMFVLVAAASLLIGLIITGSLVSRYLLPLAVFPVLMIVPLAGLRLPRSVAERLRAAVAGTAVRWGAIAGVVAVVGISIAVALPPVRAAAATAGSTADRACLESWIAGREVSGVGSFWSTRALELYGDEEVDVQQVNFDFSVQLWMNNAASYRDTTFSYVLADRDPDWAALAIAQLGEPREITACPTFDVYDYAGTPGEAVLNERVAASLAAESAAHGF